MTAPNPDSVRVDYTREELIAVCEDAIVPQAKWGNRDSGGAHVQVGKAWALLRAGCEFTVRGPGPRGSCSTDENTIWIDVWWHGFQWFETFEPGDDDLRSSEDETFYLPTPARLERCAHGDWY